MAETGPTRSDRDKLKGHRVEKPYDRAQQRPQLKRSASIVDSLKSIVAKPFSWLTSKPLEQPAQSSDSSASSATSPRRVLSNGTYKRRASSSDTSEPRPTPKKPRRASPGLSLSSVSSKSNQLRTSASVPFLSSQSAALRPPRASFLPPLPRTSTPSRQNSVEPGRITSPAVRASPSVGSAVFVQRAGSLTPQASFDNGSDRTAFGLRYRSPFMPRASPIAGAAPAPGISISRQSSVLSDRGHGNFNLRKPRTTLVAMISRQSEVEASLQPVPILRRLDRPFVAFQTASIAN